MCLYLTTSRLHEFDVKSGPAGVLGALLGKGGSKGAARLWPGKSGFHGS
jgi:hypothetical protein